ncbi:A/G-specific adenine glycosylase [Meiothermus sp. QL-1]|uniref:A/G-specific adenine glycosylase n=1 Tax=Meiothermus sp. QL-1 TaxID=2058095 RepID=UPI000E0B6139|nr:A/G-specific adenine glycosylase [Meiothermus sp. QL-1]RDI95191.1 A/G-specific adenine glycosylase [Meiothermus sp. QL-1]
MDENSAKEALVGRVLGWYQKHRRLLPWRGEQDPYRVLLSEVLLQQTRAAQAIPYYHRFLARFPTLEALAQATEEEVLWVWQGCGYYTRARNLHRLARQVSAIPSSYAELRRLPGLGPYTAAAVASIAFGEPVAAVDGNVRRVLARLWAWEQPKGGLVRAKAEELMREALRRAPPGEWNQALIELGALVCTPRRPECKRCPAVQFCQGREAPERYPRPQVRKQQPQEMVALVLQGPAGFHLEKRPGGVLGGLWGVPMEEEPGGLERLLARFGLKQAQKVGEVRHEFTHRRLLVRVYQAPWEGGENPGLRPLSRLDRKVLELAGARL